jgi:hypothetical protein
MDESFVFSEAEIANHYNENINQFDKVNYREFRVSRYLSDTMYAKIMDENDGEEPDLNELVDSSFGEIDLEAKFAYDMVSALAANPDLTEENFNELAALLAWEEDKPLFEDPDYTLVGGETFSGNFDHDHSECGHDHSHENTQGNLSDWLFESERSRGDVTFMQDGNDFVTVMFLDRIVESDLTVNMRQIVITPISNNDAGWEDAENRARTVLNTFNNGDEQRFISLVRDNSADQNSRHSGGLYTEIRQSDFNDDDARAEWLFDPARRAGDFEIVRGSSGVHILYFSSWGRPFWQVNTERNLRRGQVGELRVEKSANAPVPKRNWLGMRLITVG